MTIQIEELQLDDAVQAIELILESFSTSIAATLEQEGIDTFSRGLNENQFRKRLKSNLILVCRLRNDLVGLAEVRDSNHLTSLFVKPSLQRQGIGRLLIAELKKRVKENQITVNASLNSIEAYTNFGFVRNGSSVEVRGIRAQPMILNMACTD